MFNILRTSIASTIIKFIILFYTISVTLFSNFALIHQVFGVF